MLSNLILTITSLRRDTPLTFDPPYSLRVRRRVVLIRCYVTHRIDDDVSIHPSPSSTTADYIFRLALRHLWFYWFGTIFGDMVD